MGKNRKNDPRYPIYWTILGFTEEESKLKAKSECRKKSVRCIEYWLNKGLSLEDAKNEVRRIQNNGKYNIGRKATDEQKRNLSNAQKRINNLEYWIEKYGENDGKTKYENFINQRKENSRKGYKARIKNDPDSYKKSSIRRPEYWISQGYSENEAKLIVSKKQSRGIDFFINKYGEDLGLKKWKEKNDNWYSSFYLSNNDLIEINNKRKLNSHVGYYTKNTVDENSTLNFYLISLIDSNNEKIIKYGLTKQDKISKRWKISLNYNLMLFKELNSHKAIDLENEFHKSFKHSYSPELIKTTECFAYSEDNLKETLILLKKYGILNLNEENVNG
jgi:hypothetical protein